MTIEPYLTLRQCGGSP